MLTTCDGWFDGYGLTSDSRYILHSPVDGVCTVYTNVWFSWDSLESLAAMYRGHNHRGRSTVWLPSRDQISAHFFSWRMSFLKYGLHILCQWVYYTIHCCPHPISCTRQRVSTSSKSINTPLSTQATKIHSSKLCGGNSTLLSRLDLIVGTSITRGATVFEWCLDHQSSLAWKASNFCHKAPVIIQFSHQNRHHIALRSGGKETDVTLEDTNSAAVEAYTEPFWNYHQLTL